MSKLQTVAAMGEFFTNAKQVREAASLMRIEAILSYLATGNTGYPNGAYKYNSKEFAGVVNALMNKAIGDNMTELFNPFKKGYGFEKMKFTHKMTKEAIFKEGLELATSVVNSDDGLTVTGTKVFHSQEEIKEYLEEGDNLQNMVATWKEISGEKVAKEEVELTAKVAIGRFVSAGKNNGALEAIELFEEGTEGLTPQEVELYKAMKAVAVLANRM